MLSAPRRYRLIRTLCVLVRWLSGKLGANTENAWRSSAEGE